MGEVVSSVMMFVLNFMYIRLLTQRLLVGVQAETAGSASEK
jgi:hypothetical protein